MSKININVKLSEEKIKAIKFYSEKKDVDFENEVSKFVCKLYEKYVPKGTREYIESIDKKATEKSQKSVD